MGQKQPKLVHPTKLCFKNRGIIKVHHPITKVERISHQQAFAVGNIKRNSLGKTKES